MPRPQFSGRTKATVDNWQTPPFVLAAIEQIAGESIRYDAFCTPENAVAEPIAKNSLLVDWPTDGLIFANPPYGDVLGRVAAHMIRQADLGARLVVLVPAATGAVWWHTMLMRFRTTFFLGRVAFVDPDPLIGRQNPNHNSCLFSTEHYSFPKTLSTTSIASLRRKKMLR